MIRQADLEANRFSIDVPQEALDDLKRRLKTTRWPVSPDGAAWSYGTDAVWLRRVAAYWLEAYDWRAQEARLNGFTQYRVPIDDLTLHMTIEPGSGRAPPALLLLNGWPSSIVEYAEVIEPLAHPERFGGDAEEGFTVLVPSYPGFGFSDPPPRPIGVRAVATILRKLTTRVVGPSRYFIHGSDWGAVVGSWMAFDAPDRVIALHLNSPSLRQPSAGLALAASEQAYLDERTRRLVAETGYQAIQSTRPQSLAYALTDSPVGLAGWILEKYHAWSEPDGTGNPSFSLDDLLTTVTIYWLNGINAANWLYCDLKGSAAVTLPEGRRVDVPTALFIGTSDLPPPPPVEWVERSYRVEEMHIEQGAGHFPFMEAASQSQINHLRNFFGRYR